MRSKKLGRKVLESAALGAATSGVIASCEEGQRWYWDQKLQVAYEEKSSLESDIKRLTDRLARAREGLDQLRKRIEFLEQPQKETLLVQDPRAPDEIFADPAFREVHLQELRKTLIDGEQKIIQLESEVQISREKGGGVGEQGCSRILDLQKEEAALIACIDQEIDKFLGQGFKAKGEREHYTQAKESIRSAYLRGEKITWKKEGAYQFSSREVVRFGSFPPHKDPLQLRQEQERLLKMTKIDHRLKALLQQTPFQMHRSQSSLNLVQRLARSELIDIITSSAIRTATTVPVAPVDVSREELMQHVILVHGEDPNALNVFMDQMTPEEQARCFDDSRWRTLKLLRSLVTPEGIIGSYLDLRKRHEQHQTVAIRPHMHWAWNQLVQPHSMSQWENAPIAYLEPLTTFERSLSPRPYGIAPYDTFIFGSHRLSERSLILVPTDILEEAQAYLVGFRGRVVSYEGSIRSGIIDKLEEHYPETWHVCDQTGCLLGREVHRTIAGYESRTYVRKDDGQIVFLMEDASMPKSTAFREYQTTQRFLGIHDRSATFWLDSDRPGHPRREELLKSEALRRFKRDWSFARNNPYFAGSITDARLLSNSVIIKAIRFLKELREGDPHTGTQEVAKYILHEALHADLVSLSESPLLPEEFSALDATILFKSDQQYIELLQACDEYIERQPHRSFEFFQQYCRTLRRNLADLMRAKEEARRFAEGEERDRAGAAPLCLQIAEEEWSRIRVPLDREEFPGSGVEFDLSRDWPPTNLLRTYLNKILHILPNGEDLKDLYREVSAYSPSNLSTPEAQNRQYRINIIRSVIKQAYVMEFYRVLSIGRSFSDLPHLLIDERWLTRYGLETREFTELVGNCLFDNIAGQLNPPFRGGGLGLRQAAIEFMRVNPDLFIPSRLNFSHPRELLVRKGERIFIDNWDSYLIRMAETQVWGTEEELFALAHVLERPIVILRVEEERPRIYSSAGRAEQVVSSVEQQEPLFLYHVDENHFLACIPKEGLKTTEIYTTIVSTAILM